MNHINIDHADRIRRDTIGNDLRRAAEIDRRNARNLAHRHHRRLGHVMARVQRNMGVFVGDFPEDAA